MQDMQEEAATTLLEKLKIDKEEKKQQQTNEELMAVVEMNQRECFCGDCQGCKLTQMEDHECLKELKKQTSQLENMILEEQEKQKKKELWEALKREGLEVLEDLKKQKIQLEIMKRKQEKKMLQSRRMENLFFYTENRNLCRCGDCHFCFNKFARRKAEENTRCRDAEKKKLDPNYEVAVCHGCVGIPETCDICHVEELDKEDILDQLLRQKKKRIEDRKKIIRKKRLDPNNACPSPDFNAGLLAVEVSQEDLLLMMMNTVEP
jgi:hypothetical protein